MSDTAEIRDTQDIIDSRDVIARIEYLEAELEDLTPEDLEDMGDEAEELKRLRDLASEGENFSDWSHGLTLIHSDYFVEYAKDFAIDCGDFDPAAANWPLNHIDWDAAADDLLSDYSEITFAGQTFYARD